ncbi:MAG TPA: LLM class flavin-dependent oxidoreductase, partial [Limnochordales bacterium]
PGRFRLGVGPSHQPMVEGVWGIPFRRPLTHLREYLTILKAALQQGGQVEFSGRFFQVRADWGEPVDLQILASGLRRGSYELIGELADGGISWVTPLHHIQRVAIPAMEEGARRAGRPRPAMVMHVGVAVHEDAAAVREAAMRQFGFYPRVPFYSKMFVEAGYPEAAEGAMSEAMLEAILVAGDEAAVAEGLRRIAAAGVDEVICSVVAAGEDRRASAERTLRFLGDLARAD